MIKTAAVLVSLLLSAPGDWSRVGPKGAWVATLGGTQTRVKVPEGTQYGRQFRLKGKGMPVLRQTATAQAMKPRPNTAAVPP